MIEDQMSGAGRSRESWDEEDLTALRRMADAGDDLGAIALVLERSKEAVRVKARRLGFALRIGR
jgi:hypothetical protein